MATEFYIPKVTDHMEEGEIVAWLRSEGDPVAEGEGLLELQTDKAIVEIPAPATGILVGIREGVVPGAAIPVGVTVAYIVDHVGDPFELLEPLNPDRL